MDGLSGPDPTGMPFPLTDLQEAYLVGASRLVELGGLRPTFYVELDVVDLDIDRAQRAVELLLAQHEHLRTEILPEDGQRVLPVDRVRPYRLPIVDLTGLDRARQEAALLRTRQRMSDQGVPPTGWPLFELLVSRVRAHRVRVHIAMSLLLLDGRSIRQVQGEWRELYRDPLAPLVTAASSFREIRLAQVADQQGERYVTHWRYWKSRLDSLPAAPRLPLARALSSIEEVRFTRRVHHLDGEQWRRFAVNVRRHRLGATTALLHLFAETLGAWAAEPRFCLNVLHQGWTIDRPEATAVVGQFGATLPLEVELSGDFWQRARRAQAQLWRDLDHAEVSGVRITRELAARRGLAPHAFLPYVFTSMLGPTGGMSGPGQPVGASGAGGAPGIRAACRTAFSSLRTPQVLVDNQVLDADGGGVDCVWDVVDDAFPPGLPDLMFDAYRRMVSRLAAPEGGAAVPNPVPPEHRRRVAETNATAGPVPPGRLEDGFLTRAACTPDAVAMLTNHGVLSRGELAAASGAVAGWLRGKDIGRGDVVPLVMPKGWQQVVGALGVLRAGAAYCPIDAGLPGGRTRSLLESLQARVALVSKPSTVDLSGAGIGAVLPISAWKSIMDECPPAAGAAPTDLAYVIYTSGSSGQPKGVMVEHRAALNTVLDVSERIRLGPADRVLGISSLSFDLSVWDVFGTLAAGATLVLPDTSAGPDPLGWAATAARHRVSVWNSVPALAEMLVEVAEARPELDRLPARAFLLSGDWIGVGLPARMRALWPGVRIVAMGGATEAAIWSNDYEVGEVDPAWRSIPYGRPLRNQTMRVLDHQMEVRAPWAEGSIYIGGTGLARGYWRDPQRTEERFVRHPVTGERLYRTGDRGRYWPDGVIEFLGREDRQAKIQGFRVEPGEIEAVLRQHPAVRNAVVCVEEVSGGQRRLVAFAVPEEGEHPSPDRLTAFLRERLPHYLVPAQLHCLAELPLTANGKVDVAAVRARRPGHAAAGTVEAADRGDPARQPLVRRLSQLWAAVVGRPWVDPDDDFLALGGTSLLALRLVNRVRGELGIELPFGQVFQARTVRAMARQIAAGPARRDCAIELSSGNDGPAMVLFHPVGGSVSGYAGLARAWPGPVRAFQSRALADGTGPAAADLPSMTADYLAELRRHPPSGPFLLGGWSMGGVIAYEAARQLAAAGEAVDVLMIDSPPGSPPTSLDPVDRHLDFLRDLAGGRLPAGAAPRLRAGGPDDPVAVGSAVATAHGLLPPGTGEATYRHLAEVHAHNSALLAAYRPVAAPLNALLLLAGREPGRSAHEARWRSVCSRLTVHTLAGDHYSVMSDGCVRAVVVRTLAWLGEPAQRR